MEPYFFVRTVNKCVKVNFSDILYVEARRNYVQIVTKEKSFLALLLLRQLEMLLPPKTFCRIHRSYIVSLDNVSSFDQECIYLQGLSPQKKPLFFPIGRHYRKSLYQKIIMVGNEPRTEDNVNLSVIDLNLTHLIDHNN
jgi:DNA-binding LytR/AlgR family response regulator